MVNNVDFTNDIFRPTVYNFYILIKVANCHAQVGEMTRKYFQVACVLTFTALCYIGKTNFTITF